MENSEGISGILEIESLIINSQNNNDEPMASNSLEFMTLNEDIVASAEMMHADDVRIADEAPMDQETPCVAECICCPNNIHQEPAEMPTEAPLSHHSTFDQNELSATSTQLSNAKPEKMKKPENIRRSNRIQVNAKKRKSSEMISSTGSLRKRKSTDSPAPARKVRRTNSLHRVSKSPASAKGSNQKDQKKRKSTGSSSVGQNRRRSARFNMN